MNPKQYRGCSFSTLCCRSTSRMIDLAFGDWFIQKFISLAQVVPDPVQSYRGESCPKRLSFHFPNSLQFVILLAPCDIIVVIFLCTVVVLWCCFMLCTNFFTQNVLQLTFTYSSIYFPSICLSIIYHLFYHVMVRYSWEGNKFMSYRNEIIQGYIRNQKYC